MSEKVRVSVVVPVKNEAANLTQCLNSLLDFDDVVVVDSGSTDGTVEIAASYSRSVVQFEWNGKFPKKRNWALKNIGLKYPWVLFLDADEIMTEGFVQEIKKILPTTKHNAFWVFYDNWYLGKMLRFGDSMRKLALLRVGSGVYENIEEEEWSTLDMEIHEHLVVEGSTGIFKNRLKHYDKRSLVSYYNKHNEYASWEANRYFALKNMKQLSGRQRLKYKFITWPIFPFFYFVVSYIFKGGFLDGRSGYHFALGKMCYFSQIQAKIYSFNLSNISKK